MAEAFGVVAGAVGIAAIFSTCVECFDYVQAGRHFGVDFQTQLLTLSLLKLRLSRWGESVHVYDDPQLRHLEATAAEINLAKDTLFQILVLLEASSKVSERYLLKSKPNAGALYNRMRALATKRQRGASLGKLACWALYHKEQYMELVEGTTKLLDNLEQTFPAPEAQRALVQADIEELSQGSRDHQKVVMNLLNELSSRVDQSLQIKTNQEASKNGVFIQSMQLQGNARARDGNFYSTQWKGEEKLPQGRSVVQIGTIHADGNARIANGDSYGEKDDFLL